MFLSSRQNTRSFKKVMPPIFSDNVIAVTVQFTWTTQTYFEVRRLFLHKVSVTYNRLLPTLSKTLCTSAVKFLVSTSEHMTKTLIQFVVICKMASEYCILYRTIQVVVGGCQILAVRRLGQNGPSHYCDCLTCAQAGVRPGIVVKEKDVFHVSVRTNCTDALSQFVQSFTAKQYHDICVLGQKDFV
jgi:hypothetical protein